MVEIFQDAGVWDALVKNSRNGTIFHTRKFLSYHKNRFEDCSLTFEYKNKIVAVFPAAIINNKLISHPGSSFGGIITDCNIGLKVVYDIVNDLCKFAKDNKFTEIRIRMAPYIYNNIPCDDIEFALLKAGFKLEYTDLCSVVNPSEINIKDSTSRNIGKAVSTRITIKYNDVNWKDYWEILEKNLKDKHNTKPTHTLEEILHLKELFSNKIYLISAYRHNKMIAGVVIFDGNDNAFEIFYIAQDYNFQKLRALSYVLNYCIRMYSNKFINFGVSTENNGTKVNWGLFKFKEGFGARGVLRKTYKKEISVI